MKNGITGSDVAKGQNVILTNDFVLLNFFDRFF